MTTDDQGKKSLIQNSCRESEFRQRQQGRPLVGSMEPTKWRSRSLSELPGHLRVPILRRKDTERTQARLEAGMAGLAELRLLREQQMVIVEQTVAATAKQRQRPPAHWKQTRATANQDFEMVANKSHNEKPPQQQVEDQTFCQPWQSTASLCSITEETPIYGDRITDSNNMTRIPSGGGLCTRSFSQSTLSPEQKWEGRYAEVRDNNQIDQGFNHMPQQNTFQRARNQAVDCNDPHMVLHRVNSDTSRGNHSQTTKAFGETDSCKHFDDSSSKRSPNSLKTRDNFSGDSAKAAYKRRETLSFSHQDRKKKQQDSSISHPYRPNHKRAASVDTSSVINSTARASKHLSWDNLLILAGLQKQSFDTEDDQGSDILSQSPSEACRKNSLSEPTDRESSYFFQDPSFAHMNMKKGRSHSFCCDSGTPLLTKTPNFSYAPQQTKTLNIMDTKNKENYRAFSAQNDSGQDDSVFSNTQTSVPIVDTEAEKTNAIIRRASIQCETVLTGGIARTRKIFNPLHEIDVVALRSPGPLHAVTLQYNGIPLNALPEEPKTAGTAKPVRGRSASEFSLTSPKDLKSIVQDDARQCEVNLFKGQNISIDTPNKSTKQPTRRNLQPILESGSSALSINFHEPENVNINAHSQIQANVFKDNCQQDVPCKEEAPHFAVEPNEADQSKLSTSAITDQYENNYADMTKDGEPIKDESSSMKTLNAPVSLQKNYTRQDSSKSVFSGEASKSQASETPVCLSPDTTCQPNPTLSTLISKSNTIDLCPGPPLRSARPQHTSDVSLILSDDGYSTCDSLGPHSRLSIGPAYSISSSSSTSDWSSLSSGSVSNVSVTSGFFPSSALRRTPGFRPQRFSHPLNSPRRDFDRRSNSCSTTKADRQSLRSTLMHVPEVSNSDTASSSSLCQDEPERDKEIKGNFDPESFSSNEPGQLSLTCEANHGEHESTPDIDSVFTDEITIPENSQTYFTDNSTIVKDSHQNLYVPSSSEKTFAKPVSVVGEEGAVTQLEVNTGSTVSVPPRRFPNSSTKGHNSSTRYTKHILGRVKMIPNKGVRQTAV